MKRINSLPQDWIGKQFCLWTVVSLEISRNNKYKTIMIYCRCKCGKERWVYKEKLKSLGSLGCQSCRAKEYENTDLAKTLRYRYNGIVQRCNNSLHIGYHNYGGRGIQCKFKSAKEFVGYILEALPHESYKGLDIGRINNDGHYEPGNLALQTKSENILNSRRTIPKSNVRL